MGSGKTEAQAVLLANRLAKRHRHLRKYARRAQTDCFRVFDNDIPEIPLAVDLYGPSCVVSLYERPYEKDEAEEEAWLEAMAGATAESLGLPRDEVFLKRRKRQRGEAQYEKEGSRGAARIVTEGGLKFEVNLSGYLDTGLFLDHRDTRSMVREGVAGKTLLNLFCYTGSFSVYAASGGAARVVSVDLSTTYLEWALRNFALNGLSAGEHAFVKADALEYVEDLSSRGERFSRIVLDPPTFSNSKSMRGTFDVVRDHSALVRSCLGLLEPGGELFFSTNARRFTLDPASHEGLASVRDLSDASIPEDFRDRKIHRLYHFTRGG